MESRSVQVPLSHQVDVAGFHSEAKRLLAQQVPPESVEWAAAPEPACREEHGAERATMGSRAARALIPQSFVRMSELVVMHRDPDRFGLLYRSLWRLVYEPELKHDYGDSDLARLRQMAQAVRRDLQKMKTRLAFQSVPWQGGTLGLAWYEPGHFVCEAVGAWLAGREPAARWVLLTPDRAMRWDGERLLAGPGVPTAQRPDVADPAGWLRVFEISPASKGATGPTKT